MKVKLFLISAICILFISFSAQAINFAPEEVYNSVVVVYTNSGVGSGFVIRDNTIITNAHVVDNYKHVTVNLYDDTELVGEVTNIDSEKDLALITVNSKLNPIAVNKEEVKIGQEVYTIGAPKDIPYTMTKGIVSALDRKIGKNSYIQLDASVNSGNSGGPLIDENGKAIGIITLKVSDAEGIGFAININDINVFLKDTLKNDETTVNENDNSVEIPESTEDNKIIKKLIKQNEILKIIIMILCVLFLITLLLLIKKIAKHRKKDDFDFEIEIEE